MSVLDPAKLPQDLVAIFHSSFNPTAGHEIDWSLKASDELDLSQLEFNCLPSGLHLVERDVVYFSKGSHRGVCVYRRRQTTESGHRGFRLSSLGILLAPSARPRPWRHVSALQALVSHIYTRLEDRGDLQPTEKDWESAQAWFEARKVRRQDLGGAGDWRGWSDELDDNDRDVLTTSPTMHLPHLIRILGPSIFTLYKHVLGRRRILIFTLPPVQAACTLCQVAADLCFDNQLQRDVLIEGLDDTSTVTGSRARLRGEHREGLKVLGMVTLNDLDRMRQEGESGTGWIACTTDAIFLERPSHYDLLIDLTSSTPSKYSRPNLHLSTPIPRKPGTKGPTHTLSSIHSTWSDVKLWTELDRILSLDSSTHAHGHHSMCCSPPPSPLPTKGKRRGPGGVGPPSTASSWPEVWRLYEDVCVMCAGLWFGGWRRNSLMSYSTLNGPWGAARTDDDDDLTYDGAVVRTVGAGIEGRPSAPGPPPSASSSKYGLGMGVEGGRVPSGSSGGSQLKSATGRRASGMSGWSASTKGKEPSLAPGGAGALGRAKTLDDDAPLRPAVPADAAAAAAEADSRDALVGQAATARALLQTFDAHTRFTLDTLGGVLARGPDESPLAGEPAELVLTPKDIVAFELGPMNALDARFVEWLIDEYGGGVRVSVKRGWRELFGLILGLG